MFQFSDDYKALLFPCFESVSLMPSTFKGWSAYDIVGPLNKTEVRAVLLDFPIERRWFRTWDLIEEMLLSSSDAVKDVVYRASMAKKNVEEQKRIAGIKRKRELDARSRNVRRRLGKNFDFMMVRKVIMFCFVVNGKPCRDFSSFMALPTFEEERQCYEDFYDATSNESLQLQTCPICAREKLQKEGERTMILSDPSIVEVLGNGRDDDVEVVLRDLLEIEEGEVCCWMCFECLRSLECSMMPKLSLANNLWIGDIPFELADLTIPEQLLIARHYPRCYIFKLFPRDMTSHFPLDQLYSGMAGNASLFELNTREIVEMLKGQRMPSPVQTLVSVIAITFVSSKTLPMDWLKKTFRVRRGVVCGALVWLKRHNPIYSDICLDMSRLEDLPEDDIPQELLSIVRQEDDDEVVERERESYMVKSDDLNDKSEDDSDGNDGKFLSLFFLKKKG